MASAAAPRHGRAPDLPVRPVIATPSADPDGPVSVGSLLRREGRRAAHALDRPLVPRARDLGDPDGRTTHGAAVAAGALLAVTAVLGSNALGDPALLSGIGIDDAADYGPAAVPDPAPETVRPPSPVTGESVGRAVAALQEAGGPVQAVLAGGLPGSGAVSGPVSGAVSGAGIVAAVLGSPGSGGTAAAESDDDARDRDDTSGDDTSEKDTGADTDSDPDDDRSSSSRADDRSDRDRDRGTDNDSDREDDGGSDERASGDRDGRDDTPTDTPTETDDDPGDVAEPRPSASDGDSSGSSDDAGGSAGERPDAGSAAGSDDTDTPTDSDV